MRKLITLSEEQDKKAKSLMGDLAIDSLSELLRTLIFFYEQNSKRAPGRPKSNEQEGESADDDDSVEKYKVPDKFTTSPYSYNDLVGWYEMHPEAGAMPARKDLILHKNYRKS